VTNREFSEQEDFINKCNQVFGCYPDGSKDDTRQHKHLSLTRQASKYRRKKGIVYKALK